MNKNIWIWVAIIAVIIILIVALTGGSNEVPTPADTETTNTTSTVTTTGTSTIKSFAVHGSNFTFDPTEIRVQQGDTVRITLTGEGWNHDWKVDELDVATRVIKPGETDTIEFVADEKGTFEYYCSVGNHRAMGMVGNLIVE